MDNVVTIDFAAGFGILVASRTLGVPLTLGRVDGPQRARFRPTNEPILQSVYHANAFW
jgi:hypothetical protein